jgi:hypothetical protein
VKFTCDTKVLVDVLRDPSAEEAFRVFLARFIGISEISGLHRTIGTVRTTGAIRAVSWSLRR